MTETNDPEALIGPVSDLVGWRVMSVVPVRRGGNNGVFHLIGRDEHAALKIYPAQTGEQRDRLGCEFAALTFLAGAGVTAVPRPIGCDAARRWAAYEWIEGVPPKDMGAAEIAELAEFFLGLQRLRDARGASELAPGATPALSPASVVEQLTQRLDRLRAAISAGTSVAAFVDAKLAPEIDRVIDRFGRDCAAAGLDFAASLDTRLRILSPSDFGFHNALRRPDGSLAFLDFEYFGWDEPAKAVADVMLHAGMSLTKELGQQYYVSVSEALKGSDPAFPERFAAFFPVFRAIWCLILLNEFVPERWARRVFAGAADDRAAAEARQLKKAQEMLERPLPETALS